MVARAAGVEAPVGPFEALLGTGFVRWDPGEPGPPVEFAHPLYREAVYQDLSPTRRRDLHRAVAGVLTPASVLAHRVAAADGVDAGLADELEAAARREIAGGGSRARGAGPAVGVIFERRPRAGGAPAAPGCPGLARRGADGPSGRVTRPARVLPGFANPGHAAGRDRLGTR